MVQLRQNVWVGVLACLVSLSCSRKPTEVDRDSTRPATPVSPTPPMPWPAPAPLTARVGDILVTAATHADSSPAGAPKGAVLYTSSATLRNTAASARTVQLRNCPLWLSVHAGGGWYGQEGRPLEWDQIQSGRPCGIQPTTITLSPGQTFSMSTSVFAHDLLAANVRPNYGSYFHAHLHIDTADVTVQADSAVITYPTADLVPSATSVLAVRDTARSLTTTVTLDNRGELPSYLEYGACATRVLAYRTTARDAVPVWDSNQRRMWSTGQSLICLSYLAITTIQPGVRFSPREFVLDVPLMDVLGDSLPDGHYYFRASVGFSNRAAMTDIPAGDAEIAFPRPTLATTRRSFILEWKASPVRIVDGSVRATVIGTVVNANSALVDVARDCPVLIRVYRDRERRDAAPRSGAPDWSQPTCGSAMEKKTVFRGEQQTLETSVPIREILGASMPSGRYYFAVVTRADGMEMTLSAGELDLTR